MGTEKNSQLFFPMPKTICHHGDQLDASLCFVWMLLFCSESVMDLYNFVFLEQFPVFLCVFKCVCAQFEIHF